MAGLAKGSRGSQFPFSTYAPANPSLRSFFLFYLTNTAEFTSPHYWLKFVGSLSVDVTQILHPNNNSS